MNARMQGQPRRQRGAVIVLMVVALLAILAMAALALDGGHMLVNKTRLQNAVDAAALSGAKTLSQVSGDPSGYLTAITAARNTLTLNASAGNGNGELAAAIAGAGGIASFVVIEFSDSVYGPFANPPAVTDPSYVRVSVPDYSLSRFFWDVLAAIPGADPAKRVAAIATAGPSPSSPCDVAPLMVCGDPAQYDPAAGMFWGYRFGDLQLLKTAANDNSPIGPGNFQLLNLNGNGGNVIRDSLAGGVEQCNSVGDEVLTKPGNTVGPSVQGLNTRFGDYQGGMKKADYPPDLVITSNSPALAYDDKESPPRIEYRNEAVTSSDGHLSTAGTPDLFDYHDWAAATAACIAGTGAGCQSGGVFERRMLKIVVGQCNGTDGGKTPIPVLGFGCFFVLQPAEHKGNEAQIFGQFVKECEGDNVAGPNPSNDSGPRIIQLYKTYIDNARTPSSDS